MRSFRWRSLPRRYTRGILIRLLENDHGTQKLGQLHEVLAGYPGNCELQFLLCLADGSRVSCRCDGMKVAVSEPMRSRVEAVCGRGNLRLLTAPPSSATPGRRNGGR